MYGCQRIPIPKRYALQADSAPLLQAELIYIHPLAKPLQCSSEVLDVLGVLEIHRIDIAYRRKDRGVLKCSQRSGFYALQHALYSKVFGVDRENIVTHREFRQMGIALDFVPMKQCAKWLQGCQGVHLLWQTALLESLQVQIHSHHAPHSPPRPLQGTMRTSHRGPHESEI